MPLRKCGGETVMLQISKSPAYSKEYTSVVGEDAVVYFCFHCLRRYGIGLACESKGYSRNQYVKYMGHEGQIAEKWVEKRNRHLCRRRM